MAYPRRRRAAAPVVGRVAPLKYEEEFTPGELWERVLEEPQAWPGGSPSSKSGRRGEEWDGNVIWPEAKALARDGWPEGLKKIAPIVARVDELVAHAMPEPRIVYEIAGDAPDVGAYLAGIPENMLATEIQDGASRMLRLLVNVGASAAVSAETIEARGVVACALVDALERVGYRVEVVTVWNNQAGPYTYNARCTLKRAEEPLALDRLAFALIHPAFMRRLMLRCMETIPNKAMRDEFVTGSYGHARPVQGAPGDVVITEMYGTDWTPARLADEVSRYLAEIGVHVDGPVDGRAPVIGAGA